MKKHIILCITAFIIFSCVGTSESELQEVTIANRYTLTIPKFLTSIPRLNRDASLQYQNAFKEFYVIVIDESKTQMKVEFERSGMLDKLPNTVEEYTNICLPSVQQSLKNYKEITSVDTTINNMPAKLISFTGTIEDINIFYQVGYYEGKNAFYQTLVWTIAEKEEDYKEQMNAILYTLTEIEE